ncbi:MAG TPA: pitrilysin family protein [Gemmatimonadaceae bacterium]|jgi:zinc protease|nr:pitrilysin family protein [Gemmatimonadaceae bacterium]
MTIATRPHPSPTREYHFPRFEHRQLPNGLKLVVAPVHKLPMVTILALVEASAMADPHGKEGIAQLTARAITEGTTRYDGETLTERLEQLGTSIDASADWDTTGLTLTVLTDKLGDAFKHLAEVLTTPIFPETSVQRIKAEQLAEILQVESEPRALADEMFEAFVYAEGSRFTAPIGGTKTSIPTITRQDILDFYTERYRPTGTTLIVVGDVTTTDVEQMAQQTLGAWTGAAPTPATVVDKPARTTPALQIVSKNDAPQSELRVGHLSVSRTHPDYFKITVMNAILGGLFSSRINLNLREAHGYTYGARSEFDWRTVASPFLISTAVASNVTAPALQEILHEINRMRDEPISESELSLATSYLNGVFPIRFETTAAIATALATLSIYHLPDNWYDTYRDHIGAVTAQDVLTAMQTHVNPEKLQIVVVGPVDEIRDPLEALHIGPVTVREAEHSE